MPFISLESLIEKARTKGLKQLAVAVAEDEDVLNAVRKARSAGLIEPILVGNKEKIESIAKNGELPISDIEIIHEPDATQACKLAVKLIAGGKASILMKGLVSTNILMRAVLEKENGITCGNLLSHIAFFESPYYHKIFCVTDAAMNISPDFNEKVSILQNAVHIFHKLGVQTPRIGILAAVETVNPKMEATVHAAMLKAMNNRNQLDGCIIDGPFALDNAVSKEAASHKGIISDVAGDIDILLAPDINSGNILYKSLTFLGGSVTAAIITGATMPIVLTSRADSAKSKYLSIALAAALG
jgi:phosphate butyryltransferase